MNPEDMESDISDLYAFFADLAIDLAGVADILVQQGFLPHDSELAISIRDRRTELEDEEDPPSAVPA